MRRPVSGAGAFIRPGCKPKSRSALRRVRSATARQTSWPLTPKSATLSCVEGTSADQVPVKSTHSKMPGPVWVVLIAGSTGAALSAVRPPLISR